MPVPAWTSRWRCSAIDSATASAIAICPVRSSPPSAPTAALSVARSASWSTPDMPGTLGRSADRYRAASTGARASTGGGGAFDGAVDGLGRRHVADGEGGGADHAGPLARSGRHDAEVLGRQRERPLVDRLAECRRAGPSPAAASAPPITMTDGLTRLTRVARTSPRSRPAWRTAWIALLVAVPDQGDHVAESCGTSTPRAAPDPRRPAPALPRSPPGSPGVAASTGEVTVVGARQVDVAEVACGALGAALQGAPGDDAGADAGRDLDEHQVGHVTEMGVPAHPAP